MQDSTERDTQEALDTLRDTAQEATERVAETFGEGAAAAMQNLGEEADRAIDKLAGISGEGIVTEFRYDGSELVAERRGDATSETTFVLLHGIGMGRKVFADLTRRLEPDSLVVAVDLPGYGEAAEPPRTPTIERMADLVAAYIRQLDRRPVVLIGHSMGTHVATEVAARHPATVGRLVLVAPTVDIRARRASTQLRRLAIDLLDDSPKVLLLGAREYLRAGPHLRRKMHAMLAHKPEDAYPQVKAPTLVLRGEHDLVSPVPWCQDVVGLLRDGRLVEIAGSGHETLIRDAGPAERAIREFLSDSTSPA